MKALLVGYYGARNLGDDMMLFCLSRWLRRQDINVTVVSENPQDTQQRFGLPAVQNAPLLFEWGWKYYWGQGVAANLLRAIKRHEALIVGGGDLIRDDRGWRTFLYTVEKVVVALLLRKPVYMVNIGIRCPTHGYSAKILPRLLSRCQYIIARDESTYNYAKVCAPGKVNLLPDIATLLPYYLGTEKMNKQCIQQTLRVCLRQNPDAFACYPFGQQAVQSLAQALDEIIAHESLRIVFTPFQCGDEQDNELHAQVRECMRCQDATLIEDWEGDLRVVAERVATNRAVLAMRLHAGVLSVATETPCAMMPYDRKVREFAQQAGIETLIETVDLLHPERVITKVRTLFKDTVSRSTILDEALQWVHTSLRA